MLMTLCVLFVWVAFLSFLLLRKLVCYTHDCISMYIHTSLLPELDVFNANSDKLVSRAGVPGEEKDLILVAPGCG